MRLSPKGIKILKIIMHVSALIPLVWLWTAAQSGMLGAEPVERIIHFTGIGALNLLVVTLAITPLAQTAKMPFLMQTRRLLGLYCFAYASLHIFAFLALDLLFSLSLFIQEMTKRPYIILGGIGYLFLFVMAFTSIDYLRKKMGKRWQQVHNSILLCAILLPIHFYWSLKSGWIEPVIYFCIFGLLLAYRRYKIKKILAHYANKVYISFISRYKKSTRDEF